MKIRPTLKTIRVILEVYVLLHEGPQHFREDLRLVTSAIEAQVERVTGGGVVSRSTEGVDATAKAIEEAASTKGDAKTDPLKRLLKSRGREARDHDKTMKERSNESES